jgi:flagellar motor switch protein FliM
VLSQKEIDHGLQAVEQVEVEREAEAEAVNAESRELPEADTRLIGFRL